MRSNRRKKIIAGSLLVIVVLVVGSLFTANYAVSRVMDLFVAGMDADSIGDSQTEESSETQAKEPGSPIAGEISKTANDKERQQPIPSPSLGSTEQNHEASPVPVPAAPSAPGGAVTKEQVAKVQDNLTVSDKASVIKVVFKNLSIADLKSLRAMADGGLSLEEKKTAKLLLLGKLSSDEYNELSALAKKYGISKGRSYEEAKQENP